MFFETRPSHEARVDTVDFCELVVNEANYEEKTVRTVAILAYGGEDHLVLYCPKCYTTRIIRPFFTDYFRAQTKGKRIGKLPQLKKHSGTIKVIVVGKLSTGHLMIDSVEKAKYLSKDAHFSDRLSPKVREKANCKED